MYHMRLASIGTNTLNYVTKCGFLLAEKQKKKENISLTHGREYGFESARGLQVTQHFRVQLFLLPSAIAWPAPPTRP